MTEQTPVELESRLLKVYRYGMYGFGLLAGGVILAGTWFGLQMVQKHDQAYQRKPEAVAHERIVTKANPFQKARTVKLKLPYLHGTNPLTISYLTGLYQERVKTLPNYGFVVDAEYRSGSLKYPTQLTFSCKDALCQLAFELPSRLFLLPQFQGQGFVYPKRDYEIHSHGYAFKIEKSKLTGIAKADDDSWALFNQEENLRPFYQEAYFDQEGKWIHPKG